MSALPDGVTREVWHDIDVLRIETPSSTARISLHGGQVLSFAPAGFDDLLWLSPTTAMPPKAIRGGVPVCWPYFGRQGQPDDAPQHGHARVSRWPLTELKREADGGVVLKLTQALHTYFRVADAMQVAVTGLDGLRYADKYDGDTHVQSGDWSLHDVRDPGRSDRIYAGTGHRFELIDPAGGRRIRLDTFGSRSLVLWNPGEAGACAIADMPDDGWRNFVCLEAANAGEDAIELEPGQRHRMSHVISVSSL